jgi:pimeloyl-ACP methyl ester carboxylesterase
MRLGTRYHRITIDEAEIFYREAGNPSNPTMLLLHGFPASSHMFRNLIERLAPDYHLIAPDYPGFGFSNSPSPATFDYSFEQLALIMEKFIDKLGLRAVSFYLQDYGGPIGFRIISKRPELVKSLIIQNANMYLEGLGPDVLQIAALTKAQDTAGLEAVINHMMSFDGIKEQYLYGAKHPELVSPDCYHMDNFLFQQPGIRDIQKILFNDYASNFPLYPQWQMYLRTHRPPVLIVWGRNDKIFPGAGALAYKRDLPAAEIYLFDGGHFILEEYVNEIAELIHIFIQKKNQLSSFGNSSNHKKLL